RDAGRLALMPVAVVGLYALNGGVNFARAMITRSVSWQIVTDLRERLYAKMLELDLDWQQSTASGEKVSRLMADVNNLQYATSGVVTAVQKPLTLVVLIVSAFYMNAKLAAIALVLLPLVAVPIQRFGARLRAQARASLDSAAKVSGSAQESFTGIRVVQVFGAQAQRLARFVQLNRQHQGDQLRATTAQLLPGPTVELIAALGVGAALWVGGQDVFVGALRPGELIAFLVALGLMNDPLKGLGQVSSLLQRSVASAELILELLDRDSGLSHEGTTLATAPGEILVQNVRFSYGEEEVLKGISFRVSAGERVAIVGASGSGKTTLLSLLARLRDPTAGGIFWDGVEQRQLELASFRRQLAMVTQEPFLFDESVADNIRFGSPDAPDARVEEAAQVANAHTFVRELPQGYQTFVNELGMRLSGGQRQRLCIARAVLRGAPVLLLDEATSNLDAESEALVNEALDRLM
ncbi:MAG TPA: ABC transporter ATP-binding protein, partial [Myxococcota bacterium]|nr:ABC transporter ATP-binding protein [Myxococcota bacterium]